MFTMPAVHVSMEAFFKLVVAQKIFDCEVTEGCFSIFVISKSIAGHSVAGCNDGYIFIRRGSIDPVTDTELFVKIFRLFNAEVFAAAADDGLAGQLVVALALFKCRPAVRVCPSGEPVSLLS